ncbi:hypothetical protein [Actinoplanes sp. NPDC051851]|uniref:hypothetical protein n=1 Tax=Actinoplanes sp. NPDC051851 TaxID=3154753 RepID=UPI003435FDA3
MLRDSATAFANFADELSGKTQQALAKCALPGTAIPITDFGFKEMYEQAYSAADQGCRAVSGILTSVSNALVRVANHWDGQDSENAKAFGEKPIPAPEFPSANPMPSGVSGGDAARFVAAEGLAIGTVQWLTYEMFVASALIPALITHFAGIAALANLRDPVPYFQAEGGWSELEAILADAAVQVPLLANKITSDAKWEGDGADAFSDFIANQLGPALGALKDLVGDLKQNCLATGLVMSAVVVGYIVATIVATKVIEAAAVDPEPVSREAIGWSGAAAWVSEVLVFVGEIALLYAEMAVASATVQTSLRTVSTYLGQKGDKLHVNSLALSTEKMTAIQSWENDGWINPKLAKQ